MSSTNANQLQIIKQNIESLLLQRQQLESQLTELTSALTELSETSQSYKIIGKIMVASSKDTLRKDIEQKKEVIEIRIKNIIQQEEKLKQNMDTIQKEAVKEFQEKQE
ncbi:prefoldin subunit beta [Candidatus Woesearchaeota archaeon]|jgi:prefoldin beta subunit|nr:prefoldin subunit beta [Candidatus Woesearchaeota archaeon]MBT5396844.1 prefoldin subunit beta [Candidatus Woesearchaeota archaeon]MBT5924539.1 prefoldin subunit beta [Candidatus Woesearchaeota archaeon]MBT6367732.1 prefoldin subunit beta [Candidatus Woesearchaeota archaeon]MBT7762867.1 prefoldin subunit beta [Candidatus Woesearchaeota archaeon]